MITLHVKNLDKTIRDLRALRQIIKKDDLVTKVAANARNIVQQRNLSGKDVELKPFKKYSKKPIYLPLDHNPKPKGGRIVAGKGVFYENGYGQFKKLTTGTATPNLFASGDMMRSFQAKSSGSTRARVAFIKKREAEKALRNERRRKFVGINTKMELPLLQKTFTNLVELSIRKAGF